MHVGNAGIIIKEILARQKNDLSKIVLVFNLYSPYVNI